MGACCCTDKPSSKDELLGSQVSIKSAWINKGWEGTTHFHEHTDQAREDSDLPTGLLERLNGLWIRKDDGKPLGEMINGQLVWDSSLAFDKCKVDASGPDSVKIRIKEHE
ncbi:unnamed protein product, partial [Effrenium voratum]